MRSPSANWVALAVAGVLAAGSSASTPRVLAPGDTASPYAGRAAGPERMEGGAAFHAPFDTDPDAPHSFYFTRAVYSSGGRFGFRGRGSWATDYPKSDLQFLVVLQRLTNLDVFPSEHPVRLDDPELLRYPVIYALEVGRMAMTPAEVQGLRQYLLAGGFLIIDDFWGTYEWANFEREISRVFPEFPIVEMPMDHPIFDSFYKVTEVLQVPNIGNARAGRTWEQDGYVPHVRGIFNDDGRLMVVINWNTDLGDAWEWAEQPDYPLKYSTYAFQMGVNFIVYAMSH